MTEPDLRPACADDVIPFTNAFGDYEFFTDRLRRQRKGLGVLFVAWLGDRPAGDVYLWLERAEEEPIHSYLPGVALLTHLQVHPDLQSNGVGSALIDAAEHYLVQKGHERVALAVRTDNVRAARLYDRLGYVDWDQGEVVCYTQRTSADGVVQKEAERCHVLVKLLMTAMPRPRTEIGPIGAVRGR